jgi:hypothetical protein
MKHTTLTEYLVPANQQDIYCHWGFEEIDGLVANSAKIVTRQSKWAILFRDEYYLTADGFTLMVEDNLGTEFHFNSRESAIAAWEQFKVKNNFQRYQELIDVAIALELDTEPHEFDPIEYAGCLEEGSLIELPEPTVFALFFRDGELQVLNYSLTVYLSKKDCTEADLDQAIAYFGNLQEQSVEQAKKVLLAV